MYSVRTVYVRRGAVLCGTTPRGTVDHLEESHDDVPVVLDGQRGHPADGTEARDEERQAYVLGH